MSANDDKTLFREALADARPLRQDRVAPDRPRPRPVPEQSRRDERAVVEALLSHEPPEDVETGEELVFVRAGIQHALLRRLRRGQFATQAELDLHGLTVAEARQQAAAFIQHAGARGWRCVRIVHGKGNRSLGKIPVLKTMLNAWLRKKDEVLAFCSARPEDGGTGAVYVLLKKQ